MTHPANAFSDLLIRPEVQDVLAFSANNASNLWMAWLFILDAHLVPGVLRKLVVDILPQFQDVLRNTPRSPQTSSRHTNNTSPLSLKLASSRVRSP